MLHEHVALFVKAFYYWLNLNISDNECHASQSSSLMCLRSGLVLFHFQDSYTSHVDMMLGCEGLSVGGPKAWPNRNAF